MSLPVTFSDVRGENVSLNPDKKNASWKNLYSGGVVFSHLPLETDKPVLLFLRGTSARVNVGFYKGDPKDINDVKELYFKKEIDLIAQFNVHDQECSVDLKRNDTSFTCEHAHIPYTKNVVLGTPIWIAIYIQFGYAQVQMKIRAKDDSLHFMPFHSKHGNNIQVWDDTMTTVAVRSPNPAAMSLIELNPTQEKAISVTLRLKPCLPENDLYGLNLSACRSTSKFQSDFHEYVTTYCNQNQPAFTKIEVFKRQSGKINTCDGELTVKVEHGGRIKYHHDSAGTGSAHVTEQHTQSGGITLILDLFQVSVDIIDAFEYEPRDNGSDDEECSSMSSVNSAPVVSACLDNCPTSLPESALNQQNTPSEMLDDSSPQDNSKSGEAGISRKRTEDSCSSEPVVQPKQIRLHDQSD